MKQKKYKSHQPIILNQLTLDDKLNFKTLSFLVLLITSIIFFSNCRSKDNLIEAAGVVDGETVLVKSLVGGQVTLLELNEGDRLVQDSLVAQIDDRKIQKRLEALDIQAQEIRLNQQKTREKINLLLETKNYWEDKVQRLNRLKEKQSVAGDELQQALLKLAEINTSLFEVRQALKSLQVKLEALDNQKQQILLQLADYSLEAPASGLVLRKFINQGETVFPGQSLAEILITSSLFVETFLEEEELSHLRLGHPVDIFIDGLTQPLPGEITFIGREAEFSPKYIISEKERKSLLYRVKIKVKEGQDKLKLGMPVTVNLRRR